jgi:heat-inducible transcriptional repressor
MELTDRKKKILAAVVDEYIRTAEPVGSKTIAALGCLDCSPATIRNELAELVSMGYPGAAPHLRGARPHAPGLPDIRKRAHGAAEAVAGGDGGDKPEPQRQGSQLDNAMTDIGRLTSQLTNYPALALAAPAPATIQRFDIIYVDANTFIIVVMMSNNTAKSKLVHLPASVTQAMIQKLSSLFNANFTGITDEKVTAALIANTERAADDSLGLTSVIASFVIEVLSESHAPEAFVTGENRLLNQPEFRDPDKAHKLMSYLSGGGYILPEDEALLGRTRSECSSARKTWRTS